MNLASRKRSASIWAAVCYAAFAAVPAQADETPGEPSADTIGRWVADLDGGSFAVRRAASRHLRQAGRAAVEPLASAANGNRAEVARRAVDILDALSRTSETETRTSARAALRVLATSSYPHAAQPAATALRSQRIADQRRAVAAIGRLGGELAPVGIEDEEYVYEVRLGKKWKGGKAGLEHLADLVHVSHLLLHGAEFNDESLARVRELTHLQSISLYTTEVTDEGEESLRKAFPGVTIDRRRGAMLGVRGSNDPRGCKVDAVVANGAAQIAGIEMGDVVTQIGGDPVHDLRGMIAAIARYKAGEQARVEFLRGTERLARYVKFGELDVDALR
ncbi:MAG TPA: PDZ domain-containing protein [Pirellulales bacterium]|nr:PDZ domain-containing protein [Pirellulales bacterium]